MEFTFSPPYWVHAVLWMPLIVILSLVFLRLSKSTLLVLQYKHKAGEGRASLMAVRFRPYPGFTIAAVDHDRRS